MVPFFGQTMASCTVSAPFATPTKSHSLNDVRSACTNVNLAYLRSFERKALTA